MYPPVRSCGEKDLQDNGRRDLDEEICSRLCDYYPDWKNPKGTHMVPRSFISKANNPNLGEITEKHFFDILKEFGEIKKEPMFVIHSYKFSEYIPMWQSGKISSTKMSNWVMGEQWAKYSTNSQHLWYCQILSEVSHLVQRTMYFIKRTVPMHKHFLNGGTASSQIVKNIQKLMKPSMSIW